MYQIKNPLNQRKTFSINISCLLQNTYKFIKTLYQHTPIIRMQIHHKVNSTLTFLISNCQTNTSFHVPIYKFTEPTLFTNTSIKSTLSNTPIPTKHPESSDIQHDQLTSYLHSILTSPPLTKYDFDIQSIHDT